MIIFLIENVCSKALSLKKILCFRLTCAYNSLRSQSPLPLFPPQKHMRRCRLHPSPWDTRCSAGSAERNLPKCRVREQAMKEGGHFMQNLVCLLGTVWFYLCSQLTSATSKIKSFCWDTLHSVNGIALIGFGTLGGCAGQRCVSLPCDALEEEHV